MMLRLAIISILLAAHTVSCAEERSFYIGGSLGYSLFPGDVPGLFVNSGLPLPLSAPTIPVLNQPDFAMFIPGLFANQGPPYYAVSPGGIDPSLTTSTTKTNINAEDLGWKVYGGYHLNGYLDIELGYSDLGNSQTELNRDSTLNLPPMLPVRGARTIVAHTDISTSDKVSGFQFSGLGRYPLTEHIRIYGKIGGYAWTSRLDANFTTQATITYTSPPVLPTETRTPQVFSISQDDDGVSLVFGVGAEYEINDSLAVRAEWERFNEVSIDEYPVDLFSLGISYRFNLKGSE